MVSDLFALQDDDAPMLARKQGVVTRQQFADAALRWAAQLPETPLAMNVCPERGAFMVAFCAVLARGGTNLLPQDALPRTLARLREHWPGACTIRDRDRDREGVPGDGLAEDYACDVALLLGSGAVAAGGSAAASRAWQLAADHVAAVPFTSGSTGAPQPQPKRWGAMQFVAAATEARFFAAMPRYGIVATVPSQHMYGLEMTLMLALGGRAVVAADRPLLPADVAAASRTPLRRSTRRSLPCQPRPSAWRLCPSTARTWHRRPRRARPKSCPGRCWPAALAWWSKCRCLCRPASPRRRA